MLVHQSAPKKDKHHMLTIFITSSWQQGQVIFLVETKVRQMKRK